MLKAALTQYGIKEWPGPKHNPEILKYFEVLGVSYADETGWCSAFINWCALETSRERTGQLVARSWLKVGEETDSPCQGDVVVFWRERRASWKGHVGLYIREDDKSIWVLGGNQNDMVCIKPYDKKRLLGYRQLRIMEG